jgi:hypothetical protein
MIYKRTFVPNVKNHTIKIPRQFFGKKVEVIVVELGSYTNDKNPSPPFGKKISINELFENFGAAPDFPTIDKIRVKAWPSKW